MGKNIINIIICFFQIAYSVLIFFLTWIFLRPPGLSFNSFILVRGGSTAKAEERLAFNIKNFSAHKMQYVVSNLVNFAPVPFFKRQSIEQVKIFVVSVNKQGGKGLSF